jgi:hypothetical protein
MTAEVIDLSIYAAKKKFGFVPLSASTESPMREKPNPANVTAEEKNELLKLIRITTQWLKERLS